MAGKTSKIVGGVAALGGAGLAIWYFFFRGAEVQECATDADCSVGYICVNGKCVPESTEPNVGVNLTWD